MIIIIRKFFFQVQHGNKTDPPKSVLYSVLMLPKELDKREEIIFLKEKKNVYCMSTFNSNGNESYLHVMYIIYFCTILFQVLLVCDHSKRFYINSNIIALQKVTYLRAKSFRFIKIYTSICVVVIAAVFPTEILEGYRMNQFFPR